MKRNTPLCIRLLCMLMLLSVSFTVASCSADPEFSYNQSPNTDKPQGSFISAATTYGSKLYDFIDLSSVIIVASLTSERR